MKRVLVTSLFGVGCISMASIGSAFAGGLERGGYNIDLLFDPSRFAADATATYVMPDRTLDNVVDIDPADGLGSNGIGGGEANGVRDTEDYWVPRIGVKFGAYDAVDCMFDYSQPWGAHTNPGDDWVGVNYDIETKVNSDNYAGTCSYKFQAGKGELRLIGGAFYQEMDGFQERLVLPVPTWLRNADVRKRRRPGSILRVKAGDGALVLPMKSKRSHFGRALSTTLKSSWTKLPVRST